MKTEQIMHLVVNYAITRGNYRECHSYANKTFLDADREILQNAVEALVQEHHARGVLAIENGIKAEKLAAENESLVQERDANARLFLEAIKTVEAERDGLRLMEQGLEKTVEQLVQERDEAQADALEQARLCGMGGEREADLLGKVARLERERDALKAEVKTLRDAATALAHQIDIGDFVDDHGHSAKMLSASIDLKKLLGDQQND